jgi:ribonuclease D
MAPAVVRLLEDKKVPKVGLSWHDDILQLHKRGNFTPGNFIDLQKHVGEIGVEDRSLQKLYANFFGKKISKSQQLSNWENDVLQERQKYMPQLMPGRVFNSTRNCNALKELAISD